MNLLYVSNISPKRMSYSFSGASIEAAHNLQYSFISVANRSCSTAEDIQADEEKYGVKLLHVDLTRNPFSLRNFKAYRQLCKIIRENQIDCIHCNTPTGGVLGRLAGKKCKVSKVIYQAHGFHFFKGASFFNRTVFKMAERIMSRYTDALITINQEDYEAAQKFKLRKGGKVYFVHGVGIDLNEYEGLDAYRAEKRKELSVSDEDIVLISMGDLIARKNYATAIRAVAHANNPHLRYFICGTGSELENLRALAEKLGISSQVHFLGYRTDVKQLLAAADVFLFATLQEGLPRSMMEAMASGLPCIASKIRGNVDLITEGEGGYLCNPTDVGEFAAAICALCENPEARELMRRNNLERIRAYDISVVEKEIREIYEEVFGDAESL